MTAGSAREADMLIDRARKFLLFLLVALCAACEGGGGNPGTLHSTPSADTGTLDVVISNLPSGASAAVHVTGPDNFMQDLTQSQTIPGLAAGTYSIAASSVTIGNATFTPSPASQSAVVAAGASVTATVSYASSTLSLATTVVASGMDNPVFLAAPPGDQRLFIVERTGRIRILQNAGLLVQPFLDLSTLVSPGGEGGLLSLAFDPQYASNGFFYVYFTDLDQNIEVARYTVSQNPNVADGTSGLTIVLIPHPTYINHFGGLVAFGTDGFLYLGTGDGGGEGDPLANGQNQGTLLGKLLRIDVSAAAVGRPYTIPPSNPFVNQPGRRGEIWAWGLRNPWRYAFDGSQLYIADVGQDLREEVDIAGTAQGGLNYGWNTMEGTLCFNATTCDRTGLTLPAFEYDHGHGCAIIGGYVYRGTALPELAGHYFYSDLCDGFLKSFLATVSGLLDQRDWGLDLGQVVSFGQDGQGELYLMTADGNVDKIIRGTGP
jgi:glucose/arabinose dehydrogenase